MSYNPKIFPQKKFRSKEVVEKSTQKQPQMSYNQNIIFQIINLKVIIVKKLHLRQSEISNQKKKPPLSSKNQTSYFTLGKIIIGQFFTPHKNSAYNETIQTENTKTIIQLAKQKYNSTSFIRIGPQKLVRN
eukprot:TRINITY_DN7936_c0_g1_i8.p1 TRINITY_DN7936_c0_g1~~TRINITY_DN7936_c0_g1_i8.p1  ORF type:complete len:131 (+),score=5.79 TRINITY_DN7936_c0_g1_i8:330-722(+)